MRAGYDEVVLLTGFPSFRGRRLAAELLSASGRTLVHAVVHRKFAHDAAKAVEALPVEQRRRIVLTEGDAGAMDLGLSGVEFRAFAAEVDRIHHAAQVSYLGVERPAAEYLNVGGMREVLELGSACASLRSIVVQSSVTVSGDRTGVVYEEDLDCGQRFRNVVEETLARAERMARAAMARLPIVVLRPPFVVGDSESGEIDRLDGPYLLILLMLAAPPEFALPLPAQAEARLQVVPIDYVTRSAVALGRDPRALGRTVHLVDAHPIPTREVMDLVARAGGRRTPRGFLPANLTKALLRAPGLEKLMRSPRAFLDAITTPVTYDTRNARELLDGTGIECPPLATYVEHLVTHVQKRLQERASSREADEHDPLA